MLKVSYDTREVNTEKRPRVPEFAAVTTADSVRGVKPISIDRERLRFEVSGILTME